MLMQRVILEAKAVSLKSQRGGDSGLSSCSMQISHGDVLALVGNACSGKSALLKVLSGLIAPDAGQVMLDGNVFSANRESRRWVRQKVSYISSEPSLFPHKSLGDNLMFAPCMAGHNKDAVRTLADRLLSSIGLGAMFDAYPHQLPIHQQKRVSVARSLMLKPKVVLFDEPVKSVDDAYHESIYEVIKALAFEKMTIVIACEEFDFVSEVADRMFFIEQGKILEAAEPDNFINAPQTKALQQYLKSTD